MLQPPRFLRSDPYGDSPRKSPINRQACLSARRIINAHLPHKSGNIHFFSIDFFLFVVVVVVVVLFFETGFLCVALAVLELTL